MFNVIPTFDAAATLVINQTGRTFEVARSYIFEPEGPFHGLARRAQFMKAAEAGDEDAQKVLLAYCLMKYTQLNPKTGTWEKRRDGSPAYEHSLQVANKVSNDPKAMQGRLLHDVPEDSRKKGREITPNDLRDFKFSEKPVTIADGTTRRPGEKYLDYGVRCGLTGPDANSSKRDDLLNNMAADLKRWPKLTAKQTEDFELYQILYTYLSFISYDEKIPAGMIAPGTPMRDFAFQRWSRQTDFKRIFDLVSWHSSETPQNPDEKLDLNAA